MGKTYRRDNDRKFRGFQKTKPKKLKYNQDEPKHHKRVKFYSEETENET